MYNMTLAMQSEQQRREQFTSCVAFLRERFEQKDMLVELQSYPNFVVWRYTTVDGQRKKPPFHPATHRAASPTDRTT